MRREEAHPKRLGTPFVESLTSVGRRLAELDVRSVPLLLDIYVVQALRSRGRVVPFFIPGSLTEAVNGSTSLTRLIVEGLARGFDIPDLAATTFLATAGEVYSRKDFRTVRAWCPLCLREDGYDQLIWSFWGVTVCVRHDCVLVTRARCGHEQKTWSQRASATGCTTCGSEIGDAEPLPAEVDPLTSAYVQVISWLQSGRSITRGSLAAGIAALVADGEVAPAQLARATGLSGQTVDSLQAGAKAMQLASLTAILARTPFRLEDLLTQGALQIPAPARRPTAPHAPRHDLSELERILRSEALLPREQRRTLAAIGSKVGRGARYASIHLPDLVKPWRDPATRRRGRRKAA